MRYRQRSIVDEGPRYDGMHAQSLNDYHSLSMCFASLVASPPYASRYAITKQTSIIDFGRQLMGSYQMQYILDYLLDGMF